MRREVRGPLVEAVAMFVVVIGALSIYAAVGDQPLTLGDRLLSAGFAALGAGGYRFLGGLRTRGSHAVPRPGRSTGET
jgi:hypothetical protein